MGRENLYNDYGGYTMMLINEDNTDVVLTTYKDGSVILVEDPQVAYDMFLKDLTTDWLNTIKAKGDVNHITYEETLPIIKDFLDASEHIYIHTDVMGNMLGAVAVGYIDSLHRGICLGTFINFNTGGSYIRFFNTVLRHLSLCGYSSVAVSGVKGKYYTTRFIDL